MVHTGGVDHSGGSLNQRHGELNDLEVIAEPGGLRRRHPIEFAVLDHRGAAVQRGAALQRRYHVGNELGYRVREQSYVRQVLVGSSSCYRTRTPCFAGN